MANTIRQQGENIFEKDESNQNLEDDFVGDPDGVPEAGFDRITEKLDDDEPDVSANRGLYSDQVTKNPFPPFEDFPIDDIVSKSPMHQLIAR